LFDGSGNVVQGNYIGTDASGTAALGNRGDGVIIWDSNNVVGGTAAGARNVISANGGDGVNIFGGSANVVQGNYVGTDASGAAALGNGLRGVEVDGSGNMIGGTAQGAGNVIAFNLAPFPFSGAVTLDDGTGNAILSNDIF